MRFGKYKVTSPFNNNFHNKQKKISSTNLFSSKNLSILIPKNIDILYKIINEILFLLCVASIIFKCSTETSNFSAKSIQLTFFSLRNILIFLQITNLML